MSGTLRSMLAVLAIWLLCGLFFSACASETPGESGIEPAAEARAVAQQGRPAPNPERNAYFGDLHVHTRYSFDAFIFGTVASPDEAYAYARGGTIDHPSGYTVQLSSPLDFYAVTDHAFFLGHIPAMTDPDEPLSKHPAAESFLRAESLAERRAAFQSIRPFLGPRYEELLDNDVVRSAWKDIVESANRNYEPGVFTTFVGYEYTSGPQSNNLHRNVIFRGSEAPDIPFTRLDSQNPEELWAWMDGLREQGMETLAIPHNSNGSGGQMFKLVDWAGDPLDDSYADTRMRNEPLVEITQVKGTSDTHPLLSPNDEWADFEIFPYKIATWIPSDPSGSYVRQAYLEGLEMEAESGFNPYRFGLIGSTDTHNGATSAEEDNYFSKVAMLDGLPEDRGSIPLDEPDADGNEYAEVYYRLWGASGLAGVWAEENTRESLYDAFRRKETFATTGPRMRVRFFAGYGLDADLLADEERIARAYSSAVPMGGDLAADQGAAPSFLVWATRDPNSAPLQRVQVIKGWMADGEAHETVFDVACSDGGEVDGATHRCPDNGARVNVADCSISSDVGAAELEALWQDPDFDAAQRAFYYVRVLENPTCRWSTWDAIRAGVEPHPDLAKTIQERAWSSPIWYIP